MFLNRVIENFLKPAEIYDPECLMSKRKTLFCPKCKMHVNTKQIGSRFYCIKCGSYLKTRRKR